MRSKWIAILIKSALIFVLYLGYLQYGCDMDVSGSYSIASNNYHEERFSVVVNKLYVPDPKSCAYEIIRRCRQNSFKSIRFSYEWSIPNALYVTVYASKKQMERGKPLFSFSYLSEEVNGSYNIIDDPEHYILNIDEKKK